MIYQPEFYHLRGLALIGLGRDGEARDALHAGLAVLRGTNGRLWTIEIASLLIALEEKLSAGTATSTSSMQAHTLRQEARTTLDYIIENIPKGGIASFIFSFA